MNQTPSKVVYLVIVAISILALIGVSSLCLTLFYRNYADPAVLTAIISITSSLVGVLGTLLTNTRTQRAGTTPVTVTNASDEPVPTSEI